MLWLLVLHIAALIGWSGALLYLPALIAVTARHQVSGPHEHAVMARHVYTRVATPAALLAIAAGTLIFLMERIIAFWLVLKLTLVTGLVICHVCNGWLILYIERAPRKHETLLCVCLGIASVLLIAGSLWLVLAKPFLLAEAA